ncbi:MAG: hypothetical protein JSS20_15280, partial [Proteobacteria bacterium]|nr:hypothetical protein [Pseudomonadota bacterium]
MDQREIRAGRRARRRKARLAAQAERRKSRELALGGAPLVASASSHRQSFAARLRNHLLTGLIVVGPLTITLYVTWSIVNWVDNWVKPYIPKAYLPDSYLPFPI